VLFFFRGLIWSHLFVNLTTQSLVLFVFVFLFVIFTGFLTAVKVALFTIYNIYKAVDRGMAMGGCEAHGE
jgi:hypothetical protein